MGSSVGQQYGQGVTSQLGGKWTPEKSRFFDAWVRAEGTAAANNPFATTRSGYAGESDFNRVHVKNYADFRTGLQATTDTILNGRYDNLVQALKRDDVTAVELATAVANSPWGTGTGVLRVLGATEADLYDHGAQQTAFVAKGAAMLGEQAAQGLTQPINLAPQQTLVDSLTRLGPLSAQQGQRLLQIQPPPQQPVLAPTTPEPDGSSPAPETGASPPAVGPDGKVIFAPGADRKGMSTHPEVGAFVAQIAGIYGKPLTIGTGTAHNQYVVGTHRESDHWTGWAADIPATGDNLTRLGQDALIAAGMPEAEARKQTGGVYNLNGKQILFNTNVGGNHYNHLHVGIRDHGGN